MSNSWWAAFPGSPPLDVGAGVRYKQRESRLKDPLFLAACELAKKANQPSLVTPRQARKWNNGQGVALGFKNEAKVVTHE